MINIRINGDDHQLDNMITITELLDKLGFTGKRVAVERNKEIVPRSLHGETSLEDGDQLEIVHFIGGGK